MKRYRERLYTVQHLGDLGFVYRNNKNSVVFTQRREEASRYVLSEAQAISVRIGGGVVSEVEDGHEQE